MFQKENYNRQTTYENIRDVFCVVFYIVDKNNYNV